MSATTDQNHYMVTGANGFVGSALVRNLLAKGLQVTALVGRDIDTRNLEGLKVEIRPFDLLDRSSIETAMQDGTHLFHAAAMYSFWQKGPETIYEVNVEGTRRVFQVAQDYAYNKVVYTSSATILTPPLTGGHHINDEINEESVFDLRKFRGHYKSSKVVAETVAWKFAAQGLPLVLTYPSVPIGPGDLRPTPTGSMVAHFLRRKLKAYADIHLSIADVDDVAEGHWLAMSKGRPGQGYILGGENLPMSEVLEILSEITGIPTGKIKLPPRLFRGMAHVSEWWSNHVTHKPPLIPLEASYHAACPMKFSSAKAKRDLGYAPRPAKETLARAVEWFRELGDRS